eukprot:gene18738-biopygen5615
MNSCREEGVRVGNRPGIEAADPAGSIYAFELNPDTNQKRIALRLSDPPSFGEQCAHTEYFSTWCFLAGLRNRPLEGAIPQPCQEAPSIRLENTEVYFHLQRGAPYERITTFRLHVVHLAASCGCTQKTKFKNCDLNFIETVLGSLEEGGAKDGIVSELYRNHIESDETYQVSSDSDRVSPFASLESPVVKTRRVLSTFLRDRRVSDHHHIPESNSDL